MSALKFNPAVLLIGEAIAFYEGFHATSTIAVNNNNPGNLRGWDKNLPKDDNGFDIFPSRSAGFNALYRQIHKNIFVRHLTLQEFFGGSKEKNYGGYAPSSDNNAPTKYASFVADFLIDRGYPGISINHVLSNFLIPSESQLKPAKYNLSVKDNGSMLFELEAD